MTKIAQNTAAKLGVAFVAAAMLFSFVAPAKAQTMEELQAQIAALMAQIAALQAGTTTGTTGACDSIPAPLTIGSTGANVTALQNFLISAGMTIPAGATGYFGSQTQAALASWQAANGVAPAAGYYGPITKAAMDAQCVVDTTGDTTDEGEDTPQDTPQDTAQMELSGEGDLDEGETDINDAQDVMEGENDAELATVTLGAIDGDIMVTRMSFQLEYTGATTGQYEDQPWDAFDSISLWVDGDKVATFNSDDEDAYLGEDAGTFRVSGLELVIPEDDQVEVVVAADVNSSVDGVYDNNKADWDLTFTGLRFFDADGVATTLSGSTELGGTFVAPVTIAAEGYDDQADIKSNSDTPDAATLKVDDGNSDSDEFDIFMFDIDVDKDSSDLVLNDNAYVNVTVANPAAASAAIMADDVIDSVWLTIDGEEVEGDDLSSTATNGQDDIGDSIATGSSTTIAYKFDFNNMEFNADEVYEATLTVRFKGQDGNYENGVVVSADVDGTTWDMEGLSDDHVLTGTDSSKDFTLATVVPMISGVDSSIELNDAQTSGTVSFEFNVAAEDDDITGFDINDVMTTIAGGSLGPAGTLVKLSGDATPSGGAWTIADGDDATFAVNFIFNTTGSTTNGVYYVTLDDVLGVEVDETADALNLIGG